MEKGTKSEASQAAEAALKKTAGKTLQTAAAQTGHEELDDLTGIANQSSHNLDAILNRWGMQGVNYIGNLLKAGRGDLAAAITAMPTYAKSAIVAETNMRTFGLNDAAIAAQENALKVDMKSPIVVLSAKQIAKQQAVEARKAELTEVGAPNVQSILVQKVNEAGKTVNHSKLALNQAVRNEQTGRDALTKAQALFHKNMADTAAADTVVAAIDNLQKATDARAKVQKAHKQNQQSLNDAQQKLTDTQKQATAGVDERAKQDVEAKRLSLAEIRAKLVGKVGGQAGEQGDVLLGRTQNLDMQNAAPGDSLHLNGKSMNVINDLRNGQPPMQSVDLFSYRPSLLANKNESGIINEGSQQLESDDATVTSDKGKRPFRELAASGAVTDVGYANGASTIGPQNKTSETTAIPSPTLTPSPTASTGSPDWMTVGAGNNPYSHMGIQDADYQAYLDGKLTEADLLIIANAAELYKEVVGGSGNWAYTYQNLAHDLTRNIRVKYDPDYIKNDTYDYNHEGMYDQSSTEPMPNAPVFKTWTKLTTVDDQGGNQDGTIIDTIKNSPLGKAISKAIEPIKENVEAGVQLSDFFKQYDSSSSARVQTILEDTRNKLNGKNLTAKDRLLIRDNARSAIDDTSMFQLIGINVWYQDQAYPLYDPRDYGEGAYFGRLYDVEKINRSDSQGSFDLLGALGGLKLEGEDDDLTKPYTKGQRNMIGAMNFASILLNNWQVDDVKIMLMETANGEKRAVLQVGSSDRRKLMSEYAGTTQSYVSNAWLKGNGFGLFRALDSVAALYESVSGKNAGKWLDLKMTFDPKHKEEAYYGYIVGDEDGNLVCVSPVYPGDSLEIVNFWGKSLVYDLTDMINPVHIVEDGAGNLRASFSRIEKNVMKDIENEQSQK